MKPITIEFALTLTLLWMYLANTSGLSNEIASCFKLRVKKKGLSKGPFTVYALYVFSRLVSRKLLG